MMQNRNMLLLGLTTLCANILPANGSGEGLWTGFRKGVINKFQTDQECRARDDYKFVLDTLKGDARFQNLAIGGVSGTVNRIIAELENANRVSDDLRKREERLQTQLENMSRTNVQLKNQLATASETQREAEKRAIADRDTLKLTQSKLETSERQTTDTRARFAALRLEKETAEATAKKLQREINHLRSSRSTAQRSLEAENAQLAIQVAAATEVQEGIAGMQRENQRLKKEITQLQEQANFVDVPLVYPLQGDIDRVKITMECIKKSGVFNTRYARGIKGELVGIHDDGRYHIKGDKFEGDANPKNWRIIEVTCNGKYIHKFTEQVRRRLLNTPLEMLATAF